VYVHQTRTCRKRSMSRSDSKVQYPAACNSVETLLVHRDIAAAFLPQMIAQFRAAGVEVRGDSRTLEFAGAREFSQRAKRIGRRNTPT